MLVMICPHRRRASHVSHPFIHSFIHSCIGPQLEQRHQSKTAWPQACLCRGCCGAAATMPLLGECFSSTMRLGGGWPRGLRSARPQRARLRRNKPAIARLVQMGMDVTKVMADGCLLACCLLAACLEQAAGLVRTCVYLQSIGPRDGLAAYS